MVMIFRKIVVLLEVNSDVFKVNVDVCEVNVGFPKVNVDDSKRYCVSGGKC